MATGESWNVRRNRFGGVRPRHLGRVALVEGEGEASIAKAVTATNTCSRIDAPSVEHRVERPAARRGPVGGGDHHEDPDHETPRMPKRSAAHTRSNGRREGERSPTCRSQHADGHDRERERDFEGRRVDGPGPRHEALRIAGDQHHADRQRERGGPRAAPDARPVSRSKATARQGVEGGAEDAAHCGGHEQRPAPHALATERAPGVPARSAIATAAATVATAPPRRSRRRVVRAATRPTASAAVTAADPAPGRQQEEGSSRTLPAAGDAAPSGRPPGAATTSTRRRRRRRGRPAPPVRTPGTLTRAAVVAAVAVLAWGMTSANASSPGPRRLTATLPTGSRRRTVGETGEQARGQDGPVRHRGEAGPTPTSRVGAATWLELGDDRPSAVGSKVIPEMVASTRLLLPRSVNAASTGTGLKAGPRCSDK